MPRRSRAAAVLAPALAACAVACGGDDPPAAGAPAKQAGAARGVLLWAVGDGTASRQSDRLVRMIARSRPYRVLYLGDVYERGTAADYRRNFDPTFGRLARRTWPTPGNHEWPNAAEGYRPYWRRIRGRPLPPYYAARAGGWQVLSLNSQTAHGASSEQVRWLRARVRAPGTCRLAFWHRPRFSAGRHGDQPDVDPLWRTLAGRARLALAGHDHDSQRLRVRDGITSFVAGAGGRELYPVDERDPRLAFGHDEAYAALRIVLRPGRADLAFVSSRGRVLDATRVRCRPA
jgi:Calcineurin-like phosphoesterase